MADEYKPWIDKTVSDWSGAKTGGQDAPKLPEPAPPARELFAPARRVVSPAEADAGAAAIRNKPRAPKANYRLPE